MRENTARFVPSLSLKATTGIQANRQSPLLSQAWLICVRRFHITYCFISGPLMPCHSSSQILVQDSSLHLRHYVPQLNQELSMIEFIYHTPLNGNYWLVIQMFYTWVLLYTVSKHCKGLTRISLFLVILVFRYLRPFLFINCGNASFEHI